MKYIHNTQYAILNTKALVFILLCLILPQAAQAASPVARGITAKVIKDTQNSTLNGLKLQASDPDAGDLLTYIIVSLPLHGQLKDETDQSIAASPYVLASNRLKYIPAPGYLGQDSFTYKASDASSDSNTATISLNVVEWFAPIGIPEPEFGIKETYRMYDDPTKRNPALTYTQNAEGGYYTHYVDNTHPGATDTANTYGTAVMPRRTMPADLSVGSVVEVHGCTLENPYTFNNSLTLNSQGTKEMPVFVRGFSAVIRPVFKLTSGIRLNGAYMILENIIMLETAINFHYALTQEDHHISVRNVEGYGRGAGLGVGDSRYTYPASHIVFYNNYIHDTGDLKGDTDTPSGRVGIALGSYANHIWVVDSQGFGTGSDSFHAGHGAVELHHVYVGRNEWHHDKENAIDIKAVRDFIISENKLYGYRDSCSSGADAIRVNDEGDQDNIWIIFNEIFDSDIAIAPYAAVFRPYIIGNLIYDIPLRGINDDGNSVKGSTVVHNSFYDTGTAISRVKECSNNIISYNTDDIIGSCIQDHNLFDQRLSNMPDFCKRTPYFQYYTASAILAKTPTGTTIRVPGENFETMGIEYNDRISVELIPEITYNATTCANGCVAGGSSTRPINSWQRVGSVSVDTITLRRDIACLGTGEVSGVEITIWYYPDQSQNELYLQAGLPYQEGDIIEFNYEGIARKITVVMHNSMADPRGNIMDTYMITPDISAKMDGDLSVCDWKNNGNLNRDLSLPVDSLAIDTGTANNAYATFETIWRDDFTALNSIGQLDIEKDIKGAVRPQGPYWDIGAYEYVPPSGDVLYGDVSGDSEISAYDAALTARLAVGLDELTPEKLKLADVNGDAEVSAYDAALIAQYAVGLISKFPVEG